MCQKALEEEEARILSTFEADGFRQLISKKEVWRLISKFVGMNALGIEEDGFGHSEKAALEAKLSVAEQEAQKANLSLVQLIKSSKAKEAKLEEEINEGERVLANFKDAAVRDKTNQYDQEIKDLTKVVEEKLQDSYNQQQSTISALKSEKSSLMKQHET